MSKKTFHKISAEENTLLICDLKVSARQGGRVITEEIQFLVLTNFRQA